MAKYSSRYKSRAQVYAENQKAWADQKIKLAEIREKAKQQRLDLLVNPPAPKPRSHVSKYTRALAEEICGRVIGGEALVEIARDAHMPSHVTMYHWLQVHADFKKAYDIARELQGHASADFVVMIQRALLQGDITSDVARVALAATQWLAQVRTPGTYGDRAAPRNDTPAPVLNVNLIGGGGDGARLIENKKTG